MNLFFVGGIHGAGKSVLCEQLQQPMHALYLKASELIGYAPDPSDPTRKAVADVQQNQDRLVEALRAFRETGNILLDGHFCLIDRQGQIARVPISTFEAITPKAMVLVATSAEEVTNRLSHREGRPYSREFVEKFALEERRYAEYVSTQLGVPLQEYESGASTEQVVRFLSRTAQ